MLFPSILLPIVNRHILQQFGHSLYPKGTAQLRSLWDFFILTPEISWLMWAPGCSALGVPISGAHISQPSNVSMKDATARRAFIPARRESTSIGGAWGPVHFSEQGRCIKA